MPDETTRDIGSRPVPDPTLLTTQQLLREIQSLRDLVFVRLDGMDTNIDNHIGHLKELMNEKFAGIEKQIDERDVRTERTAKDDKIALDAALQSAKEAVAKSETSTTKQIDQIGVLFSTAAKTNDEKIDDVKDRLTLVEGRTMGKTEGWASTQSAIAIIVSIVVAAVMVVGFLQSRG